MWFSLLLSMKKSLVHWTLFLKMIQPLFFPVFLKRPLTLASYLCPVPCLPSSKYLTSTVAQAISSPQVSIPLSKYSTNARDDNTQISAQPQPSVRFMCCLQTSSTSWQQTWLMCWCSLPMLCGLLLLLAALQGCQNNCCYHCHHHIHQLIITTFLFFSLLFLLLHSC